MIDSLEFLIIYALGLFTAIGLVAAVGVALVNLAALIGDCFTALFRGWK